MNLKYAILTSPDHKPLSSLNFQEGGDQLESSKIMTILSSIKSRIQTKEALGDLSYFENDVENNAVYLQSNSMIVILVGEEFDATVQRKLFNVVKNLDEMVSLGDIKEIDNYKIEQFSYIVYNQFYEEIIKEHYIPVMRTSKSKGRGKIEFDEENWDFLTKIDGKKTLLEISELLDIPWYDTRYFASKLFENGYISFRVEVLNSYIYQVTTTGLSFLSNSSSISPELKKYWEERIQPILLMIDGERSVADIYDGLKSDIINKEHLTEVFKLMLHESLIKPISKSYMLGLFLQKYYLLLYHALKAKIGRKWEIIFSETLQKYPEIKLLLPNFEANRYQTELLVHVLNEQGIEELNHFLQKFTKPINESMEVVSKLIGEKGVKLMKSNIFNELRKNKASLFNYYKLDEFF